MICWVSKALSRHSDPSLHRGLVCKCHQVDSKQTNVSHSHAVTCSIWQKAEITHLAYWLFITLYNLVCVCVYVCVCVCVSSLVCVVGYFYVRWCSILVLWVFFFLLNWMFQRDCLDTYCFWVSYMHAVSIFAPVQRDWACFTWKSALEIRSLLLLLSLSSFPSPTLQSNVDFRLHNIPATC